MKRRYAIQYRPVNSTGAWWPLDTYKTEEERDKAFDHAVETSTWYEFRKV